MRKRNGLNEERNRLPFYPEQSDIVQPPVNAHRNAIRTQPTRHARECDRESVIGAPRGGRGGEKMTDDDFPTHDDCIHIYMCIYTPETHANGFVHNCRKRRMMIFRSDDPAYVKRGKRRCDLAFLRKQISRIAWNRDRGFPRSHRTPCDAQWFPIRFLRTCWTSFE